MQDVQGVDLTLPLRRRVLGGALEQVVRAAAEQPRDVDRSPERYGPLGAGLLCREQAGEERVERVAAAGRAERLWQRDLLGNLSAFDSMQRRGLRVIPGRWKKLRRLDSCPRSGPSSGPGDGRGRGVGDADEVGRSDLDVEPAAATRDEDTRVGQRRLVDDRAERGLLSDRTDPADDVPGPLLGEGRLRQRRLLAAQGCGDRLEVETVRDGDDRDRELPVDRDHEGLEDLLLAEAERRGCFLAEVRRRLVVLVDVRRERDPRPLEGEGRWGARRSCGHACDPARPHPTVRRGTRALR
ncbi:hypothetical protein Cus16_0381 [Curtobacterium sp. ER1/6]|nr:hypothetical protein Cus16_0381 [Curtobacterium sp. ER1/6]